MKVSVVIPVVTKKYLPELVSSIEANTLYPDWEIVIANDGANEPELLEYLKNSRHKSVTLATNVGFAGANNAGWKAASGDLLMTLNADTEVLPGWMMAMVTALKDYNAKMVGPTVIDPDKQKIQSFGCHWDGKLQRLQATNYKSATSFLDDKETHQVDGISGCCMLMTRPELEQVGYFDDTYKNSWEDTDLVMKYADRGYKIVVSPYSRITHHQGAFRYSYFRKTTNISASQQHFKKIWGNSVQFQDHRLVKPGVE